MKVYSAGVNPADTYVRSGVLSKAPLSLPYTPGQDGAGTVVQVGNAVSNFKVCTL